MGIITAVIAKLLPQSRLCCVDNGHCASSDVGNQAIKRLLGNKQHKIHGIFANVH